MSAQHSVSKTILVAAMLCVVCASIVSSVAVSLKDAQMRNIELEKKRNILLAAAKIDDKATNEQVEETFKKIKTIYISFKTGKQVKEEEVPKSFDLKKVLRDPKLCTVIPKKIDTNALKKRPKLIPVYLLQENNKTSQIILPIYSNGLWSTMYGFLALDSKDVNTVKGFGYYEHGETPGLGGEVDNKNWKAQWKVHEKDGKTYSKRVFTKEWKPALKVQKKKLVEGQAGYEHHIDAIAGATITSNGVQNSLVYWLGDHAFGPFLKQVREQGVQ